MSVAESQATSPPPARRERSRPLRRDYARFEAPRLKVMRAIARRPHRYRAYRGLTMAVSIALLAAVPLLGIARFDLFAAEHRALGRTVTALYGFIAVSVAIFAAYFLTFNVNLVAGRMFCGWGCPVGQLNRLTDTFAAAKDWKSKLTWGAALGAFVLALSISIELWWTSPGVFVAWPWALLAGGIAVLSAVGLIVFGRAIGWSFCSKACPIGLYYSVVQQKRPLGILFEKDACLDEGACIKACPVQLDPRDMLEVRSGIGGLAIDGLFANNHCLRCGACVEACELATSKTGPTALLFGRPAQPIARARTSLPVVQAEVVRPTPRLQPVIESIAIDEPELSARDFLLSGGPRGIGGSGLSPVSIAAAAVVLGLVFVFSGGALWRVPTGTSMIPRLLVAAGTVPVVATIALAVHRRLSTASWLNASAIVLGAGVISVGLFFVAFSPGSASVYHPRKTWEEPVEATARAARYSAAPGLFAAGDIEGAVTFRGRTEALVFVDHPSSGRAAEVPHEDVEIAFTDRGLARAVFAVRAGDRLRLVNRSPSLHTFTLQQDGRGVRNVPLPVTLAPESITAPAPGAYVLSCTNHETERAAFHVFDHPYFTWTAEASFRLERVPAGETVLVAVSGPEAGARVERTLTVRADQTTTPEAIVLGE